MPTVEQSIEVHVPIRTAYDQWTQFESFPRFMGGVDRVRQLDDTHTRWQTTIGGVHREFDAEVTEQHPEERVAWRSTDGTTHAGFVTFHKIDDGTTRLMVQLDWAADSAVEKIGAVAGVDDRQVAKDLERFKELIESQGFAEGSWRGDVDRD